MLRIATGLALLFFLTGTTSAGTRYEVTSRDGEKSVTYQVEFGGGKLFQKNTAFDPVHHLILLAMNRQQDVALAEGKSALISTIVSSPSSKQEQES